MESSIIFKKELNTSHSECTRMENVAFKLPLLKLRTGNGRVESLWKEWWTGLKEPRPTSPYSVNFHLREFLVKLDTSHTQISSGFNRCLTFFFFTALPQITLRPNADPITVIAGETSDIQCVVADARPTPAILWMIGIALHRIQWCQI